MSIDVTDPDFAAKLAAARETGDVWGPNGELLGQFVPRSQMKLPEPTQADYDEMDRMLNDPTVKSYTPEEVMARLRELRQCGQ